MSALREWIKKTINDNLPIGTTIWSDTNPVAFENLTGVSHTDLLKKWFTVTNGVADRTTKGTDPTFTTCTSFLPRFATKIRQAGGLPVKTHSIQTGKDYDIVFKPFMMFSELGWNPAWLADSAKVSPQEGDFFLIMTGSTVEHVGIIVDIKDDLWSLVAGGAGGRGSAHDGVKRTPLQSRPPNVAGWINVDTHFADWNGPVAGF